MIFFMIKQKMLEKNIKCTVYIAFAHTSHLRLFANTATYCSTPCDFFIQCIVVSVLSAVFELFEMQ